VSKPDRFDQHYQKQQDRKKAAREVVSPDDPPLPDTPVEQAKAAGAPGRNDPCPCGSGRKYKQCCGRGK
jgi:preprotein translocase subunit SecA